LESRFNANLSEFTYFEAAPGPESGVAEGNIAGDPRDLALDGADEGSALFVGFRLHLMNGKYFVNYHM